MVKRMNKFEKIEDLKFQLDDDEQAIEDSIARGEYKVDKSKAKAQKEWDRDLAFSLRKRPITVRLQLEDIHQLKVIALEQGIPYQTLLSSIVHRFTTGRLVERE